MHLFDIIGPIMIGPSSSHTAGAARIGLVARSLLAQPPVRARVGLYGSFADTYSGHGTDRAIIAGLMGMGVDDERLRNSRMYAYTAGLKVEFYTADLRDAHPNTAVIDVEDAAGNRTHVQASSVGGGAIRVDELDGLKVSFSLGMDTLVISQEDTPGIVARVSSLIAGSAVNIATMQLFRDHLGGRAVMVIELDSLPDADTIEAMRRLEGVRRVTLLKKQA